MPSPARNPIPCLLSLFAASGLLASAACAQSDSPAEAAQPQVQADPAAPAAEGGAEPGLNPEAEAGSGDTQMAAAPTTPGVAVLARWLRSSTCRIFITFPVDEKMRFSPSARGRRHAGWRISLPSFAGALLSTSGELAEADAEGTATAEGADGADAGGGETAIPAQRELTWTQRVGLVKADAPPPPADGADAAAIPAQPTWTQRVGLVKSPSNASPAAESVASFSKRPKKETADAGDKE